MIRILVKQINSVFLGECEIYFNYLYTAFNIWEHLYSMS